MLKENANFKGIYTVWFQFCNTQKQAKVNYNVRNQDNDHFWGGR